MKKCKSCQKEIDVKASKCPHCQADQRGWAKKHPILTGIIVLIIVFGVIGAMGSSSKGGSSNGGSNSNTSTQSSSAKTGKVGETISDGDLSFTVKSLDKASTVGNSFSQKTAQGIYYILAVEVKNNGKDTKTINSSDFKVVDSQGRKFDSSTDGQTAMEMESGSTSFFLQQVQPGLGVNGKIIFDLPKDATGLKLVAQGDLFSNGVQIDLGK